jgi:hypothetical protein
MSKLTKGLVRGTIGPAARRCDGESACKRGSVLADPLTCGFVENGSLTWGNSPSLLLVGFHCFVSSCVPRVSHSRLTSLRVAPCFRWVPLRASIVRSRWNRNFGRRSWALSWVARSAWLAQSSLVDERPSASIESSCTGTWFRQRTDW